jgi:3'-5' exonuclease
MSPVAIHNILFLDIETVPQYPVFEELPEVWKPHWQKKAENLIKYYEEETIESIYKRAGIYAEFGKIICISCGIVTGSGKEKKLILKSFSGEDEPLLLTEFVKMLNNWKTDVHKFLCAHNGKEFDFPYICRRMIINNINIPTILNIAGKKPWEISHLDTMELWKFGDYKSFTSLNLLAHIFGIPTPKDDIDGSMVGDVYWKDKDVARIVQYCQKDVITLAQVYLKMHAEDFIDTENIEIKLS